MSPAMLRDGFLGRGAPFGADLNLVLQVAVGVLLLVGFGLARSRRYRAHGLCQSAGFVLAVVMTGLWMIPAFHAIHADALGRGVVNRVTIAVAAHVVVGTLALLVGAWVVLVAGTPLIPARLRFSNYKRWMRTLLTLWWLALVLGVSIYHFSTS
jgi:uncharacterized membrane protein YozB (DUF420 family)